MRRTALFATVFLASPLALSAQSHPLVGAWTVSFSGGARMENGTVTQLPATGTLTIEAVGDSLVATLVTNPIEGLPPRPPTRMATAAKSGDVVFVSRTPARVTVNGETQEAIGVSTWMLRVNGDNLEGTTQRKVEGLAGAHMPDQPAQPVSGTRNKA